MITLLEKTSCLPELPLEVSGKLGYSDKAPVVTIRPHKFPAPEKPRNPTPLVSKNESSLRKYLAQLTYPKVIGQPPPHELFNVTTLFNGQVKVNRAYLNRISLYKKIFGGTKKD